MIFSRYSNKSCWYTVTDVTINRLDLEYIRERLYEITINLNFYYKYELFIIHKLNTVGAY